MKRFLFLLLFLALQSVAHGTVVYDGSRDDYIGNASTTIFPYNFKILDDDDIKVKVNNTTQTKGTHYSVSGVGNSAGGNVTFVTAPASTAIVTILRQQPVSQLTNYVANSAYNATRVMQDLDKNAMIDQMQAEQLARSPKVAESSTVTPTLCIDALKYIRWNAGATDLECVAGTTAAQDEITISGAGTWTNTQYNTIAQIVINSMDFATAFSDVQGGNKATDGLTVAVKVPATSTVYGANAIAAYIDTEDASTNPVAVYAQARAKVNSANIFALNAVLTDENFTGVQMQNELDFNADQAGTTVHGLTFKGESSVEPTDSAAIIIDEIGLTGNFAWQSGIVFITGSFTAGGILFQDGAGKDGNEPAIQLGTALTGNNQDSQYIQFLSRDSGGTLHSSRVQSGADGAIFMRSGANGQPVALQDFNTGSGANVLTAASATISLYPGTPDKIRLESDGQLLLNANSALGTEAVLGKQRTNNDDTIILQRATDSGPTGNFFRLVNAANNANLFQIDVAGTVTRAGNTDTISATKTVRDSAGTGTCTLVFTGGILTGGTC